MFSSPIHLCPQAAAKLSNVQTYRRGHEKATREDFGHLSPRSANFCPIYSRVTATPAQNTVSQSVTASATASNTITPAQSTVTRTISVTTRETAPSVCATTTVTSPLPTSVFYRVRGHDSQKRDLEERYAPSIPKELSSNCGIGRALQAKISSSCACFLPKTCITRTTTTSTVKTTVTAPGIRSSSPSLKKLDG